MSARFARLNDGNGETFCFLSRVILQRGISLFIGAENRVTLIHMILKFFYHSAMSIKYLLSRNKSSFFILNKRKELALTMLFGNLV